MQKLKILSFLVLAVKINSLVKRFRIIIHDVKLLTLKLRFFWRSLWLTIGDIDAKITKLFINFVCFHKDSLCVLWETFWNLQAKWRYGPT